VCEPSLQVLGFFEANREKILTADDGIQAMIPALFRVIEGFNPYIEKAFSQSCIRVALSAT
jgi:hypothetical protein